MVEMKTSLPLRCGEVLSSTVFITALFCVLSFSKEMKSFMFLISLTVSSNLGTGKMVNI